MQAREPHELAYAPSPSESRDGRALARMIVLLAMAIALADVLLVGVVGGDVTLGLGSILKIGYGWEPSLIYLSRFNEAAGSLATLVCGALILAGIHARALPLAAAFGLYTLGVAGVALLRFWLGLPNEGWLAALRYTAALDAIELTVATAFTAVLFTRPFARAVRLGGQS